MILDLNKFLANERPYWDELEKSLNRQNADPHARLTLEEAQRFHYLYQRASSDLVKLQTFAGEVEASAFLNRIVALAYSKLHEKQATSIPFRPWQWLTRTFPRTFRRHWIAFAISIGTFIFGGLFGAAALSLNYDLKNDFIPPQFGHLSGSPSKRVEKEEKQEFDAFEARHTFSATLMTHNTKVTILTMVTGILLGVVTITLLFYNGTLIGVIACDYIMDGQGVFLTAWLLPHGSFELPAIFIGGQCGLIIARAVFGWGTNLRLRQRFHRIRTDLLTLIAGAALMLIWAGVIESFLSQYHGKEIYPFKIGFGVVQLSALIAFLGFCGRDKSKPERALK